MLTDVIIENEQWDEDSLSPLAETAACAALVHQGLAPSAFEIAVLACDDDRIAELNGDFRDKRSPTNVLSWPEQDLASESAGGVPSRPDRDTGDEPHHLGDIALAFETCAREAEEQGKTLEAHVTHLVVHAVLHLLGYDHIRDEDATLMERAEVEILGNLGLPDPYRE
ncbi:rRNA maturation RNase YbeY [Thalassococcus lentus]|uniref:Endoribonuclease YbeY n=1 Tax=Thalassococcus lentus TaxID=1210524 RepID=A0ABT4XSH6_9RHOB|nr:rRNA maturation RNase YbeY [Thalassococcus lentus]MDA7424913.1 rRNA maturation RNase YbeY [Thalassococcus lentus]